MSNVPAYPDINRLMTELCIKSERTVDTWVKQGILPPPKNKGGKRLWKWSEVTAYIDGAGEGIDAELEGIRNETKRQASGRR